MAFWDHFVKELQPRITQFLTLGYLDYSANPDMKEAWNSLINLLLCVSLVILSRPVNGFNVGFIRPGWALFLLAIFSGRVTKAMTYVIVILVVTAIFRVAFASIQIRRCFYGSLKTIVVSRSHRLRLLRGLGTIKRIIIEIQTLSILIILSRASSFVYLSELGTSEYVEVYAAQSRSTVRTKLKSTGDHDVPSHSTAWIKLALLAVAIALIWCFFYFWKQRCEPEVEKRAQKNICPNCGNDLDPDWIQTMMNATLDTDMDME